MNKLLVIALMIAGCWVIDLTTSNVIYAGEERRLPPPTRSSDVLSERVITLIDEFQKPMNQEELERAYVLAKEELDDLYKRRYESFNDFEKSTFLNFYINYYCIAEEWEEARQAIDELLAIDTLKEEIRIRAQKMLEGISAETCPLSR